MRPARYQTRSPIVQAAKAAPKVAQAEIFPSTASAPATTSVGIAGTGRPICSISTLAKTSSSPCCAMSRVISCTIPGARLARRLEGFLQPTAELADDASAERQHADYEDHALRHCHPGAELCQVVLHRDDDERADDRSEHRAESSEEDHEDDLARHRPVDVGKGGELEHQCFRRACETGERRR